MISKKNLISFFTGLFFLSPLITFCQEFPTTKTFTPQDTVTLVEILPGVKKLEYRKIDSVTEIQILAGNVRLKQGNTIFSCDSCVITKRLNLFEAFGNVHINDSDTADVYADHLRYLTDKRIAYLTNNVKLTDGKGVLTTKNLEYDVNTKVGIYKKGGKVVSKNTVLTSDEGYYYADLKDVYFKKNVKLKDPKYELESDSLLYNTEFETARFIAETFIKDSSNRTIRTRDGYYNQQTGVAEFGKRPVVQDGAIQATGERMYSDDASGITQIIGRAILIDTASNRTVLADEIFFNTKTESFLATKKPLMIIKQDNDSIFIAADTLFSAKLSDLYSKRDSIKEINTGKNPDTVNNVIGTHKKPDELNQLPITPDILRKENDSIGKKEVLQEIIPEKSIINDSTIQTPDRDQSLTPLAMPDKDTVTASTNKVSRKAKRVNSKTKDKKPDAINSIVTNPVIFRKENDIIKNKEIVKEIKPSDEANRDTTNLNSAGNQTDDLVWGLNKKKDSLVNPAVMMQSKPAEQKTRDSIKLNSAVNPGFNQLAIPNKIIDTATKNDQFNEIKIVESKKTDNTNLSPKDTSLTENLSGLNKENVIEFNEKDSTNRYFEAYRNVRIYSDSLQAVCDSMFYSFKDSVFRLYDDPVVWSKESQITGDTILLYTKNKKADKMEILRNSFIASIVKADIFNQVRSARMDAYFIDGSIDSVRANGRAESIYFIQDDDSAFTGINQSTSDLMDIFFKNRELERVVFRGQVKGTIWPMSHKTPLEMRLPNFKWLDNRRPKSRFELYE